MLWQWLRFHEINGPTMHEILALRQKVFVVEQNCAYLDADRFDENAFHLIGRDENNTIIVYARLLFPDCRFREPSIGRVVTVLEKRGQGLAKQAVEMVIQKCRQEFIHSSLKVSAQVYLEHFYENYGFITISEPYDEDGIKHVDMLLEFDTC